MKDYYQKSIVEAALQEHSSVDDCAVLVRETVTSQAELVAYVVTPGQFSPERLQTHLQAVLPAAVLPDTYVQVSKLPLTATGQVDEQALAALEVIDHDTMQRWEEHLQMVSEIKQVAVVVQEETEKLPPLHLADILPDWQKTTVGSKQVVAVQPATVQPEVAKARAISAGTPLPSGIPATLPAALQRTVLATPGKGIVYLQADGSAIGQSYAELRQEAERMLSGLRQLGLKPQDKVIFQCDSNQDFIPAFWGCMLGGFVPVPISTASSYAITNSTVNKLHHTWQLLGHPPILTSTKLEPAVRSLSDLLGLDNWQVVTIDELRRCEPDGNWHQAQPDELAVLIFTSGSTGRPKGVMLSHRNILSNVAASAHFNDFTSEDVSLNWLHLDHVGSLIRCCIRDIYVGSQQIHGPAEAVLEDPLRWLDWIEQYQVTYAWAPNFALGLVNARAESIQQRRWNLAKVKSLLSVAEAIVPKTAKTFLELLSPHGLKPEAMHSAWGMSETCAAVTFSHRYILDLATEDCTFVEVGAPIPGLHIRIVDAAEQLVAAETVGRLQISGAMIASGYYQNPQLNQEAFTPDGWLRTGDLGFLRQGRLTVTGREKDIIIINGLNHYSHEIEAVVEEVEGVSVSYTAACAIRSPESDTDQLAIFFHTPIAENDRLVELLKQIRGNVVRSIGVNPTYLIPVAKEVIPKTAIGKIQRSALKTRFEAGEFEAINKQVDILSGNANTLPDWFYRQIWRPVAARTHLAAPQTGCLVFLDSWGLGLELCDQLSQQQTPCVAVEARSDYAQLAANRYAIDPQNPDHYLQLLESLKAANLPIEQILHLWTYDEYQEEVSSLEALEQAQECGVYSLLFLVQALAQVQGSQMRVRLEVISSYAQPIQPDDKIAYEKAPLLGLVKTIPQEMPWLDCRHLDLAAAPVAVHAKSILQELQVKKPEREVAYRDGQRLVARLEKVDLSQTPKQELPFKRGGMYLLSGGLGEIGVEIAQYLLQHYQARLLLVGRTPLPERSTWPTHLKQEDAIAKRIHAYLSLEQLGGEVSYKAVDICDLPRLQQVVDQASASWQCSLNGVVHLAGIGQERLLVEETRNSLAATLRPKVLGTWVLHQLLAQQPDCVFISFSSVISFFGALSVGAYAAANSFLDCFWHYQNGKLQSYCFGSSTWAGVGISRGYESRDSRYAQGREVMSKEQGLNSFLASLHHTPAHLLVGLNGSNPHVRRRTESGSYRVQKLCAYFTAQTDHLPVDGLQGLAVVDRFGTLTRCEFQQLPELPLTETGEINREQLAGLSRPNAAQVAPRTEMEFKLAQIWQSVLGVPQVGIHDNFFELGGSSLLAVSLFSNIEQTFGINLPLSTLFQAATVAQLASILDQEESALWSPLVTIQSSGSKPPLFGIHAVYGHILFYRDLAHHLGPEQPFYGLQAQGLDGKQAPLTRLEDMAARYIKEIRTIQPTGPYFLVGFSLGGIIAFEIAQQLHAQDQKVALLALIDTIGPGDLEQLSLRKRLLGHLSNLLRQRFQYVKDKFQEKLQDIAPKLNPIIEPCLPDAPYELSVIEANRQAVKDYAMQVYPDQIDFFKAIDPAGLGGWEYDAHFYWSKRTAANLELHEVPAGHDSIITEPKVQILAEKLRACLDKAQGLQKYTKL